MPAGQNRPASGTICRLAASATRQRSMTSSLSDPVDRRLLALRPARQSGRKRRPIAILGAAGRDFHNFDVAYRDDPSVEVVAFTAAQIPGIAGRHYPPGLAGELYPDGVPIVDEAELEALCRARQVVEVGVCL